VKPLAIARAFALGAALLALAMILASGPGTRAGIWPWQFGLGLVAWAFFAGIAATVASLGLLLLAIAPRFRVSLWIPLAALAAGLVAVVPPLVLLSQARAVPPIHDITTDMADPPGFAALLEGRRKSSNGADYAGESIAAQQRRAYADVKPLVVKAPPREVLQSAIDAARSLGWEVVSSDASAGRIEAVDTSTWFGFKDDVVVRVRPEGTGSRIDVRSASRVGESDLGANARRIRRFLSKLT